MTVDWAVVGSVAAVLALVVAILQYRHTKKGTNGSLTAGDLIFYNDYTTASVIDHVSNPSMAFLNLDLLTFINRNAYTLSDVKIRVDCTDDVWWSQVDAASSIPRQSISFDRQKDSILIGVPFLPPREMVIISIAHRGLHLKQASGVKSESSHIKLKQGENRA